MKKTKLGRNPLKNDKKETSLIKDHSLEFIKKRPSLKVGIIEKLLKKKPRWLK